MPTGRFVSAQVLLYVAIIVVVFGGCQTLREVAQLRNVQFRIDRVNDARLAGIDLRTLRSYEDLEPLQVARLASKVSNGELPLDFTLHLAARNPSKNGVDARLTQMDWTLLLDDKETISGTTERTFVLPPGEPTDVPVDMSLNLIDFFDDNLRQLIELAAAFGEDRPPKTLKLEVQPTVKTPLGPMTYPKPITVARQEVGRDTTATP